MQNTVNISKDIVDNYSNNKKFLKELKQKIDSGSFRPYDMALYNALSKRNREDESKRLILSIM